MAQQETEVVTQQETQKQKNTTNKERAAKWKRPPAQETQTTKKKKVETTTPQTDKEILKILWKDVHNSPDKLFFIRQHETGRDLAEWHIVQVDKEAMDRRNAKRYGKYHVQYYLKNDTDAKKKKSRECQ